MRTNLSMRRYSILSFIACALFTLFFLTNVRRYEAPHSPNTNLQSGTRQHAKDIHGPIPEAGADVSGAQHLLTGKAIAPKLENATAKAELGRAAWKLFHTTFARFPDKPAKDESEALRTYVHLFQRLYPW
jgi:FAD-linked sulfhydryl oxidase